MRVWPVALWVVWAACTGAEQGDDKPKDNGDGQADGDADTDSDSDSDADADTDADTDTDVLPSTFEAEILYQETLDGSTTCSTELSLAGTPYTGGCPNCEFVFDVQSTVTSSSDPDCRLEPFYSWLGDDRYISPRIAFSETFTDYLPLGRTFTNVLWFSSYLDLPDYYYYTTTGSGLVGPVWYMVASDDNPYSQATFDGTDLEWAFDVSNPYFYQYTSYLDFCGYVDYSSGVGAPFANPVYLDSLRCDEPTLDVWEFTADAGDPIRISVDSTDAATLFRPYLQLTDDTGCLLATTSGNFVCSGAIGSYGYYYYYTYCPALEFTAPATGTYRAVVSAGGYSTCPVSGIGNYELVVTSPSSAATQLADDEPRVTGPYEYELSVRMLGTVGE
jgi:hypothetical protein